MGISVTAPGSSLGDNIGASELAADAITGQAASAAADDADSILIYDNSVGALRKQTRSVFTTGLGVNGARLTVANYTQVDDPVDILSTLSFVTFANAGATGAVSLTTPTTLTAGTVYIFAVMAAQNMIVTANTGQTIRVGTSASTAGGTVTSNTVGSMLWLVAINTTTIVGMSSGTWVYA